MSGAGAASPEQENPERALALVYAPAAARAGFAALLALDDALARLVRTTSEPALGQIRLAWWRDSLARLDAGTAPAEPVLQALAGAALPRGVTGAALGRIVDGWEVLIATETLDEAALGNYARGRGGALFTAAAALTGADAPGQVAAAGEGWALSDLARNLSDLNAASRAREIAAERLGRALGQGPRWARAHRALGAMAIAARMDLDVPAAEAIPHGAPRRVWRMLRHRLTGR
ncbi:squalene/phytoene synthase family protein [Sphingomonas canadensis]|uniref:Squalene/phytoene synthase family protein n=1 Tax=Sphingomonas canadensis TaxID=1219257 RepID=A0ABW3HBK1_9SPHN|nr:squalene/phytoene synthase family protein [Sphingomonas canadensis]MCW3836864.1 squalene/phytoene synthase family protein [Sphingomonas canadensis]